MWFVFVQILKILGITLLILFGILIVLLSLVMFVPVRYRMDIKREKYVFLSGKITWLSSAVNYSFQYDQESETMKFKSRLRILGFVANKKNKKSNSSESFPYKGESTPEFSSEKEEHTVEINVPKTNNENKNIFKTFGNKFKNIKYTITSFCDKIKSGIKKVGSFREFILLEETKQTFSVCWESVFQILRKIIPRNIKGWIHFGMEDPADTGHILGLISTVYGFFQKHMRVIPDFENQILECDLKVKGHIHGVTVVRYAFRMIFDENVQNTYKKLKNGF